MASITQATEYFKTLYRDVWQPYSCQAFVKYYDKKLIARSSDRVFQFEEFYDLLKANSSQFSHMRPEFHQIVTQDSNRLVAWFTTIHYHHNDKEAYRLNTMANYTIKNDKVIGVDFMWDKPVNLVMSYKTPFLKVANVTTGATLSKRELECFFYLIQNRTSKEIATIMSISYRTVETHILRIKSKLSLSHTRDIFEFAIQNGYIALAPLFNRIINTNWGYNESH